MFGPLVCRKGISRLREDKFEALFGRNWLKTSCIFIVKHLSQSERPLGMRKSTGIACGFNLPL